MDQERENYADRNSPRVPLPPAVVRLLAALVLMLVLLGFCLLISFLIDVD
jgi:hypothetical protein